MNTLDLKRKVSLIKRGSLKDGAVGRAWKTSRTKSVKKTKVNGGR